MRRLWFCASVLKPILVIYNHFKNREKDILIIYNINVLSGFMSKKQRGMNNAKAKRF